MSLSFQYPGLKLTLPLTKPPIVFSHMTGESTYRTEITGAVLSRQQAITQSTSEQDSVHLPTHTYLVCQSCSLSASVQFLITHAKLC